MLSQLFFSQINLVQSSQSQPSVSSSGKKSLLEQGWMFSTLGLAIILVGLVIYGKIKFKKMKKIIKLEQYKSEDLHKRLQLALATIQKWEANPDLIHSRDCNLDYIRMRMEEKEFHYALVTQVKVKIKQFISTAMRITMTKNVSVGSTANKSGFMIDEIFDITYETDVSGKKTRRVLFRIQVKLMKLPAQATSQTIEQIINCIETFLSPKEARENWQPTIQGRLVTMSWNQDAKPTPLLLLEQHSDGVNVVFRTKNK